MVEEEKIVERKMLLRRFLQRLALYELGKKLNLSLLNRVEDPWDIDEDAIAMELAFRIDDEQLVSLLTKAKVRKWENFRGKYYTIEDGLLHLEGSWKRLQTGIRQARMKYGRQCDIVLRSLVEKGECGLRDIRKEVKNEEAEKILAELERFKVVIPSFQDDNYKEWAFLEETIPLIRSELGLKELKVSVSKIPSPQEAPSQAPEIQEMDILREERQFIASMDKELDTYLNDLIKNRLDATIHFGKTFSIASLSKYLTDLFGSILYFDSLLSITQQYGLADVEIVHEGGRTGMRTGWNLALFGEPGTGKSFSTRDMILGRIDAKIYPHGIPGRNRYTAGISPARFIRMGQAYVNRVFNFIVPEFNDWFRYKGMVEPLKLAMERGEIKYELHREVIGPYRFSSFLSTNYNVATFGKGYTVTIQDPNFNAIEDRMLCRLHRLTKERFTELAQSQMRLASGQIDTEKGAKAVRDHVALIYAIEMKHPLMTKRFPYKPVLITPKFFDAIRRTREAILSVIPRDAVKFSARLEDRAIRFACAASILNYFQSEGSYIPVTDEALKFSTHLYVEEASVRSGEVFSPEEVLMKLT